MEENFELLKLKLSECYKTSGMEVSVSEVLEHTLNLYFEQNKILKEKLETSKQLSVELVKRIETISVDLAGKQIAEEKNVRLSSEIDALKTEISNLKNIISQKESTITDLNNCILEKENELNNISGINLGLQTVREKLAEIDLEPYYRRLSDDVKTSIKFPREDTVWLLSAGIQWDKFERLYEFLFRRIKENIFENYEELLAMIRKLFDIYNAGQKEPYIAIEPSAGDSYESEFHIAKESGTVISKVLLFGYKTKKGNVLKRAFVSVE